MRSYAVAPISNKNWSSNKNIIVMIRVLLPRLNRYELARLNDMCHEIVNISYGTLRAATKSLSKQYEIKS